MADLGGVVFDDYSADVLDAMHDAVVQALERCGEQAEGYAKDLTPVDTGNLRNSITHQVDDGESTVYIGTNVEYAPYVELGTGRYRRRTAHAMDLPGRRRQLALDGGKSSAAFSQTSGGRPCANLQEHHRG